MWITIDIFECYEWCGLVHLW